MEDRLQPWLAHDWSLACATKVCPTDFAHESLQILRHETFVKSTRYLSLSDRLAAKFHGSLATKFSSQIVVANS